MKTVYSLGDESPIYAPCNPVAMSAPFTWLKKGWNDFRRAPLHSITYGVIFAAIGWLLIYLSWSNVSFMVPGLFICMLIVGPALAFGLYDISQQLERNHTPAFSHERKKAFHEMGHELMLSLLLSMVFMVLLVLISMVMSVFSISTQYAVSAAVPMSANAFLLVAAIFAGLMFCASTFALPMILDKDANAMTAITTSLNAVWRNRMALSVWALLVLSLAVIGFATALTGFVIIAPLLGYASWHAYRETINA